MKTKTNDEIFESIKKNGFITKQDLQLLKNRSNRAQTNLFDLDKFEDINGGFGIPCTKEQGMQGLAWLKKFIRKDGSSSIFGARELAIIATSDESDFTFIGFYNAGNYWHNYYIPTYNLFGMQYVPLNGKPYIIG